MRLAEDTPEPVVTAPACVNIGFADPEDGVSICGVDIII